MNYNDLAVKGNATSEGHEGWIVVNSFQWGVGRGISSPTGASADRESSAPSVSEIVVTKINDPATPKLLNEALQGEGVKVVIDFTKTDKGGPNEVFLTYTLEDCMISGYSCSSGGERPSESLSLNFTKIEIKNTPMTDVGETGSPETVGYDVALAKVL